MNNSVHENIVIAQGPLTKTDIEALIHKYSEQYNVPYNKLYRIVECETANTFDPNIQSYVKYNFTDVRRGIVEGDRERSFGLAQIHLPDHPNVTMEEAKNPEFALDFMASHLSKGKHIWYCK